MSVLFAIRLDVSSQRRYTIMQTKGSRTLRWNSLLNLFKTELKQFSLGKLCYKLKLGKELLIHQLKECQHVPCVYPARTHAAFALLSLKDEACSCTVACIANTV